MQKALLLVEDSQDEAELCLRAIAKCGVNCDVSVAVTGQDAMDMIRSPNFPIPDLVVLDFHLPGQSGLDILRLLRKNERTRHLPIVMLSSLVTDTEIKACLAEGANSCVLKPVEAQAFFEHVTLIVRYWLTVHKRPEP